MTMERFEILRPGVVPWFATWWVAVVGCLVGRTLVVPPSEVAIVKVGYAGVGFHAACTS